MDLKSCLITLEFVFIILSGLPESFIDRTVISCIMFMLLVGIISL